MSGQPVLDRHRRQHGSRDAFALIVQLRVVTGNEGPLLSQVGANNTSIPRSYIATRASGMQFSQQINEPTFTPPTSMTVNR